MGPQGARSPAICCGCMASERDNEVLFRENNEHDDARGERAVSICREPEKKKKKKNPSDIYSYNDLPPFGIGAFSRSGP